MVNTALSLICRAVAALIFCVVAFATCLSLLTNPNPRWFDWVAAGPLLYILFSLAFFKSDSALVEELDSLLSKVQRAFGVRS